MMMGVLIAYVDESYDQDFYYLGAAIAHQETWHELDDEFQRIRDFTSGQHGTPTRAELHGHALMGGTDDWTPLRGKHREAAAVYRAALCASRTAGVRYIIRGVDVRRLNARYRYPDQPHTIVFRHLLERIDSYVTALDATGDQCIVVADEVGSQAQHQQQFAGYQVFGTGGDRPTKLSRISAPVQFAQSALVTGLQAVDLAIYLHYRRERVSQMHRLARKTLERLWVEIQPNIWHEQCWRP